jgi:chaperonin GroES
MIKPLHETLFVRRLEEKESSDVIMPDIAKPKSTRGEVVAIGPEVDEVQIGDVVFFNPNAREIELDGQKLVTLKQEEVLAVLEAV